MGRILAVVLIILLAVAYVVVQLVRPVPAVTVTTAGPSSATLAGTPVAFTWPTQGEAAIGLEGVGIFGTHGAQTATPLASVTKLMTAYIVLHDHPLTATATGPSIPISASDVATYQQDKLAGDSVVQVQTGEQLTERQALEALLIPSGDNIATLFAQWDASSLTAFVTKMNTTAAQLGLTNTHYTDASGVAPGTVSNAESMVRLAMADMALPAFRSIVAMAQVTLPVAGLQYNVNAMLGKDGIIGVKTGFTTSAGGCFVFAAHTKIAGKTKTVVGAVLHQFGTVQQPSALTEAFDVSTALLTSAAHAFEQQTVLHAGQPLGHLDAPWATQVALDATRSVTLTGLPGQQATISVRLPSSVDAPVASGQKLGSATVRLGNQRVTVPLETSGALPAVSLKWRLTNA